MIEKFSLDKVNAACQRVIMAEAQFRAVLTMVVMIARG